MKWPEMAEIHCFVCASLQICPILVNIHHIVGSFSYFNHPVLKKQIHLIIPYYQGKWSIPDKTDKSGNLSIALSLRKPTTLCGEMAYTTSWRK